MRARPRLSYAHSRTKYVPYRRKFQRKVQVASTIQGSNGQSELRPVPDEQLDGMLAVLNDVRQHQHRSRPEIIRATGLSRAVVAQRVSELLDRKLLTEGALGPSTGGRAP